MTTPSSPLTLANWRRTVAELYAQVRRAPQAQRAQMWRTFRAARDTLMDLPFGPSRKLLALCGRGGRNEHDMMALR